MMPASKAIESLDPVEEKKKKKEKPSCHEVKGNSVSGQLVIKF